MKKFIRYGIILLLFVIQALFLIMIIREQYRTNLIYIFIASILILVLYSYRRSKKDLHHSETLFESYKVTIGIPAGAVAAYYLNHEIQLGPVLAASIVGTMASFIPNFNKDSLILRGIPTTIYCGAFIGMSNIHIANGYWFILVASFFTAILLIVSKSILEGIGGKLGALAFTGVVITYSILYIFK